MNGKIQLIDKISGSIIKLETDKEPIYRQFLYDFKRCKDMRIPFSCMGISLEKPQEYSLIDHKWNNEKSEKINTEISPMTVLIALSAIDLIISRTAKNSQSRLKTKAAQKELLSISLEFDEDLLNELGMEIEVTNLIDGIE